MKQIGRIRLEAAMPQLIKKLRDFQSSLTAPEKQVFRSIVEAAVRHTKSIEMLDDADAKVVAVLAGNPQPPNMDRSMQGALRDFLSLIQS